MNGYNPITKSVPVNQGIDANSHPNNRDIGEKVEESEQSFTPPDRHYDFREGVEFPNGWPSQELVEFIHDCFVRYYEQTALCEEEIVKLSKQDILELSFRERNQTEKALDFLKAYDVIEREQPSRKVYYSYNPESATNYGLFEAMGALNSIDVRDEYLKKRRGEAKEAHLQKIHSD